MALNDAPKKRPGRPELPAEDRRVPVTVRLPPVAVAQLQALSTVTGASQSDVVAEALELYAAREKRRTARAG